MNLNNFNVQGLSDQQVVDSKDKNGSNRLEYLKENGLLSSLKQLVREPMVLLLFLASLIYLINNQPGDAVFLAVAIVLVVAISLFQDKRSRTALQQLKELSQPHCTVIREGRSVLIKSEDVVLGDALMVEEGTLIVADGEIVHSNDFSVNESILTGESLPVYKDFSKEDKSVYKGTVVSSGLAIVTVSAIGNKTRIGRIGQSLESIKERKTPLEKQISDFVKKMILIGSVIFLMVWGISYYRTFDLLDSLLKALTLAMSILPEEIPVALTTFMALGAWRLMKMGIVVKELKTVETLGSASVICLDKTGTITENKMSISGVYATSSKRVARPEELNEEEIGLISTAMWASEPIPFDPMELALHKLYAQYTKRDARGEFKMIHEYPIDGRPPMMTHIFEDLRGERIVAAKGAPEAFLSISSLSEADRAEIKNAIENFTEQGFRVLGVATSNFNGRDFPPRQQGFQFVFKGLVAFYDPPKKNISKIFNAFYNAGIQLKIITGDNAATTMSIANQVGFRDLQNHITGDVLMGLSDKDLKECVLKTTVFARMFPEAKLKVINALKEQNLIVAMTGDGVNDAPALKAAHIGIAMGKKGTEIARQAASLVLLDDDLQGIVNAVEMGRRIYNNLKKAIQYIISIHIPIILTVLIPLTFGWIYPNIFSPVHIIFLELIMGPTCSIIYESEPIEKNNMLQKPRLLSQTFFQWNELAISVIQGLMITLGTIGSYQYAINNGFDEPKTRTFTFFTLIVSNIFLTLVNRSFYFSIWETSRYKNKLVPLIIFITIAITFCMLYIPPITRFFDFHPLMLSDIIKSSGIGFGAVIWIEILKFLKRARAGTFH
jgi:P-type Ca2+ transporter type 2C